MWRNEEFEKREIKDFKKLIQNYFPNQKRFFGKNILNICCGPITEEPALYEHFRPSNLVSIDNCEISERHAKKYNRKSFVYGNLINLENILKDNKFDILLGRNIPLSPGGTGTCPGDYMGTSTWYEPVTDDDKWYKIFNGLKDFSKKNAIFFLTLLRSDEFIRGIEILEKAHYNIIRKGENKSPCFSDRLGVAHETKDHYLILGNI